MSAEAVAVNRHDAILAPGQHVLTPLIEYPGPQIDSIGSAWEKGPKGWKKDFYYQNDPGHGAVEVQGLTGKEWKLGPLPTVTQNPGRNPLMEPTTIVTGRHLRLVK